MSDGAIVFPGRVPELTTPRLVLRELEPRDVEGLFAIFSDPRAMRYWSSPPMTDVAQARGILERARAGFAERSALRWAITLPGGDGLVGTCTLYMLHPQCRRAEIGYALARAHWGQGLMHEALTAMLDEAFGTMRLNRLEADVDPRNLASVRALERLGFAREGLLRERWIVDGEISDSVIFGLLAGDWGPRRG